MFLAETRELEDRAQSNLTDWTQAEVTVDVSNPWRDGGTVDTVLLSTNIVGLALNPTSGRVENLNPFLGKILSRTE